MPSDQQQSVLGHIQELSGAMLQAARDKDWPALAELEAKRSGLMEGVFGTGQKDLAAPDAAQCIRSVLDADRAILERVESDREAILQELRGLKRGRHAVRSYAAEAGSGS